MAKEKVNAPFIGVVPIPSFLVNKVDVDFQMKVTDSDTNMTDDKTSVLVDTNISPKWFGMDVPIAGNVTTSREKPRSTNQTAKYRVDVSANQQPQTEGQSKLMDVITSCIELPTGSK
jgi:hypothetical protein